LGINGNENRGADMRPSADAVYTSMRKALLTPCAGNLAFDHQFLLALGGMLLLSFSIVFQMPKENH